MWSLPASTIDFTLGRLRIGCPQLALVFRPLGRQMPRSGTMTKTRTLVSLTKDSVLCPLTRDLKASSFTALTVGDVRWKRGFTDLGYSLKAAANWQMTFNLSYTRNIVDTPQFPSIHRDSSQTMGEWTNFITFSEKDRFTFGTAYTYSQGTETNIAVNPGVVDESGERSTVSSYAQHEHKLTDDLKLIAGFQANKIGNIATNVVPRLGLLWNPSTHFTLKALTAVRSALPVSMKPA